MSKVRDLRFLLETFYGGGGGGKEVITRRFSTRSTVLKSFQILINNS